jgi:hypothetical protein
MARDRRYTTVKNLISGGFINSFQEIFDTLPKTTVSRDLGMNNMRFSRLIKNVDQFVIKDVFRLAAFLEVDEMVLMNLIYRQYRTDKKGKK